MSRKLNRLKNTVRALQKSLQKAEKRIDGLRAENASLVKQVAKERDNAKSITDMIGGFKLRLMPDSFARGREIWSLNVAIMPEMYEASFMFGGDGEPRNYSRFVQYTAMDIARKIERTLIEHFEKSMPGSRMIG